MARIIFGLMVAMISCGAWLPVHAETVSNTGAKGSTDTTLSVDMSNYTEIEAVSYSSSTTTSETHQISPAELIWMKNLVKYQGYNKTGETVSLFPFTVFQACVL